MALTLSDTGKYGVLVILFNCELYDKMCCSQNMALLQMSKFSKPIRLKNIVELI